MKIDNHSKITNFRAKTTTYDDVMRKANRLVAFTFPLTLCFSIAYPISYLACKLIIHKTLPKSSQYAFYGSLIMLTLATRKIAQVVISFCSYPASIIYMDPDNEAKLDQYAKQNILQLEKEGYEVKEIILRKSDYVFKGYAITHNSTKDNGNWQIQALGNCMAVEPFLEIKAKENLKTATNTLLINGFAKVGFPTRYVLGAGFEAGLQYLEQIVKAKKIIMHGFSLGGGMMSEAILQHNFTEEMKNGTRYLMVSKCTFSTLSDTAAALTSWLVKPIFYFVGQELDSISGAKKLIDLKIPHVIVQSSKEPDDGVIPKKVSIGQVLKERHLFTDIHTLLESEDIQHNEPLPEDIQNQLDEKIKAFVASAA